MVSEMLNQAKQSGEHIMLKLDVQKAFDTMDWNSILTVVARAGMNGKLSGFLKASFSAASSNIILNGRPTAAFKLARSVRQGCPLAPLIFILGFDNLSHLANAAVVRRELIRVKFPNQEFSHVISMYADDTLIIIKAELRYIWALKAILDLFEAAFGLRFVWEKTKAAFIPKGPPPSIFLPLP